MTVHASKGREADYVIVLGLEHGKQGFPSEKVFVVPNGVDVFRFRRGLLGDAYVEQADKNTYGDPIMKKFIDVATETVFGALWSRPGLDLKTRTLICVISDAATAHEAELEIHLRMALRQGWTVSEINEATCIDPWFLREIREIVELESELACWDVDTVPGALLRRAKRWGTTDERLAGLLHCSTDEVLARRHEHALRGRLERRAVVAAELWQPRVEAAEELPLSLEKWRRKTAGLPASARQSPATT